MTIEVYVIFWLQSIEGIFQRIPLSLLEVWGRFGFLFGFALMVLAYGGFTFHAEGWGFGQERYSWDSKSLLSMALTFILIFASGYIGSSIVLVQGAQTFESLKELSVFICVVLFGYPALVMVPFAYGLSDLNEGIPPAFVRDWWIGYFINPACYWMAYQLIGKDPDFRKLKTWYKYALFVFFFMLIEPALWGYICSKQFTSAISFRTVTPALYFTTTVAWLLVPPVMLAALPIVSKLRLFWSEIPNHSRIRKISTTEWVWHCCPGRISDESAQTLQAMPIRMFLVTPFILLILVMVGSTAYIALTNSENGAYQLAGQIQSEFLAQMKFRLNNRFSQTRSNLPRISRSEVQGMLDSLTITQFGRAFVVDSKGQVIASSHSSPSAPVDDVTRIATQSFNPAQIARGSTNTPAQFHFDVITSKPLARETWLAQAIRYHRPNAASADDSWILVTALPESYFLKGIQIGNSESAMVLAIALASSLVIAWLISTVVTTPIVQISQAIKNLATGDLSRRVPSSRLAELGSLARSFNHMAEQLQSSFDKVLTSEERMKLAAKAANVGIWDWDIVSNRVIWDDEMFQQYGIQKGEFLGTYEDWASRLLPEDLPKAQRDLERAKHGDGEFNAEFRVKWPDGSIHFLNGLGKAIRSKLGHPLRMVGVNFDITERKRIEQELQRSRDEALRAYKIKSEFLANMSHEIRTPLNVLLGNADLLAETKLSPAQQALLSIMVKSGDHLLSLINDILDSTMLESRGIRLAREPFDLFEAMNSCVEFMKPVAREKRLRLITDFKPDIHPLVIGDSQRLRQVVINLLHNALKFTSRGEVIFRIERAEKSSSPNLIRFSVRDTGIGIPKDKLSAIFERFTQGNSSITKEFGGSGLGLSISKTLIELMGSTLHVESEEGKGTTFTFVLQLETTQELPAASVAQLRRDERKLKILAVDDSNENLALIRNYLKGTNYQLEIAYNGKEAVEKFEHDNFDLILMDIQMPVMDGYAATSAIRSIEAQRHLDSTPIVAVTAYALEEEKNKSFEAGCSGHLAKPISKKSLLKTIADINDVQAPTESPGRS